MNFHQLQGRVQHLLALEGWTDVSPAPDYASLVNRGLYEFSWAAEYASAEATVATVADQAEYTLSAPPDWKRVTDCLYGSDSALLHSDENRVRRLDPFWLTAAAGVPEYYWLSEPNTLRLFPKPSAGSVTLTLRGIRADTALSATTDKPGCAEAFHEGIALLAAWHHAKLYAQGEAAARAQAFYDEAMRYVAQCRAYVWESTALAFERRCPRVVPYRLNLGWYQG